jgi:molecular chaperone GrpE
MKTDPEQEPLDPHAEAETAVPEPETPSESADPDTSAEAEGQDSVAEAGSEAAAAATEPLSEEEESFKLQYLRLRADFDNFRKRIQREKSEWTQRCLENLCEDMLTVLDHYDLGLANSHDVSDETRKGFQMVRDQLGSVLGKYGLSVILAEEGSFDPNLHEAITHMPSAEVPEGDVVAMTRKGYQLGAKLLRPAQVVVSAGAPETNEEE